MNQKEAQEKFIPLIESEGAIYEKFSQILARPALKDEVIETITGDGKETKNTAKEGDYVVCNASTKAKELYILPANKLSSRYKLINSRSESDAAWSCYQATGQCKAVTYEGESMSFVASWGEDMVLKPGDKICTPHPPFDTPEVYRIAAAEFEQTYRMQPTLGDIESRES